MKNSSNNRFYIRTLSNVIYSMIITCIIETVLVLNITKIASFIAEAQTEESIAKVIADFEVEVLLLFVLSGICLFSAIFWILQKDTIKYIEYISNKVFDISKGDLNSNIEVRGDDEFSALASGLNNMVEDIKMLMEKERYSEKSKNELITNVAHDLRTPLTSIMGYLELISKSYDTRNTKIALSDDLRKQYTDIAYKKSKKLEKLIEDLFGFTKLNYGKIAMNPSKFDIVKMLSQIMDEFYPSFEKNNIAFELKTNRNSIDIIGDSNLLARLFDNLINNAIKYGADGKKIDVTINADDKLVNIAVTNYGKIIPKEELPLVFDKFYRVEQSRSESTGGTGLGLAIAKNIVDMHQGEIEVSSDLSGTSFIVTLKQKLDINKENFENVEI